jgi:hypothetical protein
MKNATTREWTPEFITRAPGFISDLIQAAHRVDLDASFLNDLSVALLVNENLWDNPYHQNQTTSPTLEYPIDAEGQLQYILGWLTIKLFRTTIHSWSKECPFFSKLSRLIDAVHTIETFRHSDVYNNFRTSTKLRFGNGETVPRGSAPLAELFNQTGIGKCTGSYQKILLWIIERN